MPTLAQVITKINSDITANGNEEITGLVLNSVLLDIVAQINDLTGQLEGLNTDDVTSIVNAINSLKQELDNFINSQTGALVGSADPNEETPVGFDGRVGTIYLKMVTVGVQTTPESYWIYTGINDIGWLNLTADDTFKMVIVDHYEDLPAQGQTNRIYFVQDENNTYIWNVNIFPNDYILVGGVIEGEYIDDTTFNDEFGSPVVPDTGNLYLDTVSGKYYRWDGNYFLPIDQDTGGGDFIPLSGTEVGKPVTGDLEIELGFGLKTFSNENGRYSVFRSFDDGANSLGNTWGVYDDSNNFIGINTNGLYATVGGSVYSLYFGGSSSHLSLPSNGQGLIGSSEFDKQGYRKAFAQLSDLEDGYLPLPTEGTSGQVLTTDGAGDYTWEDVEADFSDLTNDVIPKKNPIGNDLVDSNIQDTATGILVDGGVTLSDFGGAPVNGQLYRTGNVLRFRDGDGNDYLLNNPSVFVYQATANFDLSEVIIAMNTAGVEFNDSHIIIDTGGSNYTLNIDNSASLINNLFTFGKRGVGEITVTSDRPLDLGEPNTAIMNGNESSMCLVQFGTTVDFIKIINE